MLKFRDTQLYILWASLITGSICLIIPSLRVYSILPASCLLGLAISVLSLAMDNNKANMLSYKSWAKQIREKCDYLRFLTQLRVDELSPLQKLPVFSDGEPRKKLAAAISTLVEILLRLSVSEDRLNEAAELVAQTPWWRRQPAEEAKDLLISPLDRRSINTAGFRTASFPEEDLVSLKSQLTVEAPWYELSTIETKLLPELHAQNDELILLQAKDRHFP